MAPDTWLTAAEHAVLNELESEHDDVAATAVTCSVCNLEHFFPGGLIKANEAARDAGWLIDTRKTSNSRYRCPKCQGEPESQRGRVPPRPGKNHEWRRD